ncbi:MAG TPA: hypothetical protein VIH20_04455 [Candidatus Subteraquimicrobiales bacterium]
MINARTSNFFLKLSLIIFFVPLLVGFIAADSKTALQTNGTGRRIIEIKIDPTLDALLEENKWIEKTAKKEVPNGARLKVISQKDGRLYQFILPLKSGKKTFQKKDHFFYVNYNFSENVNLKYDRFLPIDVHPELTRNLSLLELKYQLNLPGKIIAANTSGVWGGEARWNIKSGKISKVQAKSQIVRWRLIIATGLLIIITIGAGGAEIIKRFQT